MQKLTNHKSNKKGKLHWLIKASIYKRKNQYDEGQEIGFHLWYFD